MTFPAPPPPLSLSLSLSFSFSPFLPPSPHLSLHLVFFSASSPPKKKKKFQTPLFSTCVQYIFVLIVFLTTCLVQPRATFLSKDNIFK